MTQNLFGIAQLERLKATFLTLLPFVLIMAAMLIGYKLLFSERGGAIHITSNPPGANVLINSAPANLKTDGTLRHLRPDRYDISVRMDGFLPSPPSRVVQVNKGDMVTVFFDLVPDTTEEEPPATVAVAKDTVPTPKPPLTWTPTLDSLKKIQEQHRITKSTGDKPLADARKEIVRLDPSVYTAVAVTSDVSGAMIVVDAIPTGFTTPANLILNKGIHTIQVQKNGFRTEPPVVEIIAAHPGQREDVHFQLVEELAPDTMALVVYTEPVDGRIYLDDRFCAVGEYRIKSLNYGEYLLSFGSVDGYTTPKSQKIVISEDNPNVEITATYCPILYVMATLDDKGQVENRGVSNVTTGVYFQRTGFSQDPVKGPTLKYLEANRFFAWELGYADAELNPPGMDAIQFAFQVPKGYDQEKKAKLRIYGYASNRNYPFTFLNKTEIAVYLNGNGVYSNYKPEFNVDEEHALGYDEFDVTDFIQEGENRLMIRTTENSRCYYYLNKIVLL